MLIVCIMITTSNPTPAVKQRKTQSWQRGNNREATGEEQLPKSHSSVHDSVFHEALNPSFLGRNEDCKVATALTPRHCLLPCSARGAWTLGARPWPALPMGGAMAMGSCPCLCLLLQHAALLPASTPQHTTAQSNYAYWWHGFLPSIRFLLIMITKAALQRKYFGIWDLLALLFVRKLMASLALLSRWTM